jgi:hypothetical protein
LASIVSGGVEESHSPGILAGISSGLAEAVFDMTGRAAVAAVYAGASAIGLAASADIPRRVVSGAQVAATGMRGFLGRASAGVGEVITAGRAMLPESSAEKHWREELDDIARRQRGEPTLAEEREMARAVREGAAELARHTAQVARASADQKKREDARAKLESRAWYREMRADARVAEQAPSALAQATRTYENVPHGGGLGSRIYGGTGDSRYPGLPTAAGVSSGLAEAVSDLAGRTSAAVYAGASVIGLAASAILHTPYSNDNPELVQMRADIATNVASREAARMRQQAWDEDQAQAIQRTETQARERQRMTEYVLAQEHDRIEAQHRARVDTNAPDQATRRAEVTEQGRQRDIAQGRHWLDPRKIHLARARRNASLEAQRLQQQARDEEQAQVLERANTRDRERQRMTDLRVAQKRQRAREREHDPMDWPVSPQDQIAARLVAVTERRRERDVARTPQPPDPVAVTRKRAPGRTYLEEMRNKVARTAEAMRVGWITRRSNPDYDASLDVTGRKRPARDFPDRLQSPPPVAGVKRPVTFTFTEPPARSSKKQRLLEVLSFRRR